MITRTRIAAALAAAVTLLPVLAACSSPEVNTPEGGSWSFTDDLGKTVSLPRKPERVAGLTDLVSSLWNYGITPVAAFGFTGITQDERFAGKDTAKVTEVGKTYGEINLEALAAARPDLIVTHAYPVDNTGKLDPAKPLYGFKDVAQQEAVAKIAPIAVIAMRGSAVDVIDRTAALAQALGASEQIVKAERGTFDAASSRITAAGKAGKKVLVVAAYPDEGMYVAKAQDDPALRYYAGLGVNFVNPGGKDYYWEVVSWENAGKLPADVVLYSKRAMDGETMLKQATFARTPAGKARQVYPWIFAGMDYVAMAQYMNEMAGYLEGAKKVT